MSSSGAEPRDGRVAGSAGSPMRARFREQVRRDVKAVALDQVASGGTGAVSVNAIARELGVSGPALYRYFASRDELLSELAVDAYHDLAASLAAATERGAALPPRARARSLAGAWRSFALSQPHRYLLLFTPPLPGFDAHAEPLVRAADRVMAVALDVFSGLRGGRGAATRGPRSRPGRPGALGLSLLPGPAVADLASPEALDAVGAEPQDLLRAVSAWSRIHGFVVLEIGGNFASMGIDADALFRREVEAVIGDPGAAEDPSS